MNSEIGMTSLDGSVIWLILNSPSIMDVSYELRKNSPFVVFSRIMVKHGLKLSSLQKWKFGNTPHRLTPLGYLLLHGYSQYFKELVSLGADLNQPFSTFERTVTIQALLDIYK